jgi:hypothetical protein
MINPLQNAYRKGNDELDRIHVRVDNNDRLLVNAIYPARGLEEFMLSSFYKGLTEALRIKGITYYTPENARLIRSTIEACTSPSFLAVQIAGQHEPGGANGGSGTDEAAANLPANDGQNPSGRSGGGRAAGKGQTNQKSSQSQASGRKRVSGGVGR